MGIRFIVGRAGSGKTRRCFDAIVAAMRADPLGPPIFLLLPKQATFSAERELTVASGLSAFCRTQVLSFEELGIRVLEDCGGAAVPHVTDLGRQMVLGHLLRKNEQELRYFRSVARQTGLAAELDATFAELERCGKSSDDLAALLKDLESNAAADHQDQSLLAKLHDLRLLYDAYSAYLGQERLDPHRRLAQVLDCIASWKQVQGGATAYIDGFLEFTDYERRVIAAMAKACRAVEVSLMLDPGSVVLKNPHTIPDDLSLFYRTEETYRRLWFTLTEEGIEPEETLVLTGGRRFDRPALAHVEKHVLARGVPSPHDDHEGLAMIETCDRRAEVDAAARHVREWAQQGMRFRDISVLTRDLAEYHELIDASFREHDIPYFVDRRRTAGHHPLLQFTRALLLIALHNWQHEAVMTVLKSGLCGLERDEADELENYVLLHRIRGSIWSQKEPWTFRRVLTRGAEDEIEPAEAIELDRIDQIRRRVVERLLPLVRRLDPQREQPIRAVVVELFESYERFGVRKHLLEWMRQADARGELELRDEHAQVWGNLVELFDQMVDLMGDEPVRPDQFLEILEFGLERFDLALTPPTVDQVLVGSVERTRNPQSRAVILLGMNDGQFPRVTREDSILSDGERRRLRERRLDLDPDTQRRLFDENLLAYIGFTRASHALVLTRATADAENRPQEPSPYWTRVRELFPGLAVRSIPRDAGDSIETIGTPRQLVTSLMRWVRSHPRPDGDGGGGGDARWPAAYQWLATHACCDDQIDVMRFRAWKALSYQNRAKLSDDVARRLFGSPLNASVSRIETFAACPFMHFARYGLKLQPREEQEVTALDLGNAYHQVLENIVGEMIRSKQNWTDVPPDKSAAAIRRYAKHVGESLRGELMLSSARNKYLLSRIEKTLGQVVAAHEAAARRNRLRPLGAELKFGGRDAQLDAYELTTPGGHHVKLYGKIDRVDLIEDQSAFAVIDYKLRGNALDLQRVYHGLSLQLLTYLLVLQANGQKLAGRPLTPAAAFYVRLMRQTEKKNHPSQAVGPEDPEFHLQEMPRGIFDGSYVDALDTDLQDGWSKVVKAHRKKDGTLGNKSRSDVADRAEFAGLLRLVEAKLAHLADRIIAGEIGIAPYRLHDQSPCARCEFRCLCRFDVAINQYNPLPGLSREQVLQRAMETGNGG